MRYVKEGGYVNMDVTSHSSKDVTVATKMRKEIIRFLKKDPNYRVTLEFGGYTRLTQEFANELFKKGEIEKYLDRMSYTQCHVFDQIIVSEALQ